jgi:tRNA(Ile)-lysidine synthase
MAKNLIKNIQNFVFQNQLWKREDKIVVGVSGGPDSVCLLDILMKLKNKYNFEILVAHVNYRLRGKDSEEDEKFVKGLAEKNNIPVQILKLKKNNKSSEEQMRNTRYRFFEKVRSENNFNSVAVAHNQDDQAETFLMRIIRGSGLAGMSSMKAKNGYIIRPLLETSRSEIIAYLDFNKLKYRTDKSNRDQKYLRNRIRHQLIPYLEEKFNPNIKILLARNAANVSEDYEYVSIFKNNLLPEETMSVKKLLSLHPAQQNQTIRDWIKNFNGDLKNITASHIREIMKIVKSEKNKNQNIKIGNLKLIRKGDKLTLLWKK